MLERALRQTAGTIEVGFDSFLSFAICLFFLGFFFFWGCFLVIKGQRGGEGLCFSHFAPFEQAFIPHFVSFLHVCPDCLELFFSAYCLQKA